MAPNRFAELTMGLAPVLWTAIGFLLIHLIEGYVAAPLLERHFITIPPALVLIGIVAVDLIFGTVGIVLAAPLTVVVYMLVKMTHVDDPLELHTEQ